jgi:hypothetical protein
MEYPRKGLFETVFVLKTRAFSFYRKQNVSGKKMRKFFGATGDPVTPFTLTQMELWEA